MKTKNLIISYLLSILFIQSAISQIDNNIILRWAETDNLIWERKIDRDAAVDSIAAYVPLAVKFCRNNGVIFTKKNQWVFPMKGWTKIIYRTGGKDYRDDKFDYFQGGESKGHPAHDVFILDSDGNTIEDSTGQKVEASAMVSGVIIAIKNDWKIGDFGRGGNYVKLFDPESEAIFYYSHLDTVTVRVGDIVKAGEMIGYVGRTGRKAINGKTHIHVAYYVIDDGEPEPVDFIKELYEAEKRAWK
jgi:peptidoglycan LD-endopeptidase LytH